jgi:hypothetical protein
MGKVCPVFGGICGVGRAGTGRLRKIETAGEKTQGFGQGAEFIGQLHDDRFPVVMADGGDGKHMGSDDVGLPVGERETGFGVFQSLGGMVQKVPPKAGKATVHPVVEVEVVEKGAPGGFPGVPAQSAAKAKADLRDPDAVAVAAEACAVLGKGVHGPDRLVGRRHSPASGFFVKGSFATSDRFFSLWSMADLRVKKPRKKERFLPKIQRKVKKCILCKK